jgi:ribonuclease HI
MNNIDNINEEINVYTDGSFIKNKKEIKCGYGVYFPDNEYKSIGRAFTHNPITNNRAELYAILKAIILCNKINERRKKLKIKVIKKITIYTDSEYSVKSLTIWYKNWIKSGKEYLNKDLIDLIIDAINNVDFKVKLQHVRAHTGKTDKHSIGNDRADKLAKIGANKK